ncbi:hypothetical protein [Rathayibacter sp. VKM Ac-2927]|uniref:hypothetical protein n=1 Tax=Rathayibacter sp. VKM Ac-2927 TaxID=2929478 RepID=UPI001FB24AED|nr:hypothetical protein [Rathayibacter sp. VKM Ac-2927]MCJ1687763.1 hypothetical protein [Rathayibacter sp. VKM Ac-2927]
MSVQISGQVPGEKLNGLVDLAEQFIDDETGRVLVIGVVEPSKIVHNVAKQETYPVVRFSQIDALQGDLDDKSRIAILDVVTGGGTLDEIGRALLEAAFKARTGLEQLDFDAPDLDADE